MECYILHGDHDEIMSSMLRMLNPTSVIRWRFIEKTMI